MLHSELWVLHGKEKKFQVKLSQTEFCDRSKHGAEQLALWPCGRPGRCSCGRREKVPGRVRGTRTEGGGPKRAPRPRSRRRLSRLDALASIRALATRGGLPLSSPPFLLPSTSRAPAPPARAGSRALTTMAGGATSDASAGCGGE